MTTRAKKNAANRLNNALSPPFIAVVLDDGQFDQFKIECVFSGLNTYAKRHRNNAIGIYGAGENVGEAIDDLLDTAISIMQSRFPRP